MVGIDTGAIVRSLFNVSVGEPQQVTRNKMKILISG
jgi:hypothetical protein